MSKKKSQKVLIPKGIINADEDVLIEIPRTFKDKPLVVAAKPGSQIVHSSFPGTSQSSIHYILLPNIQATEMEEKQAIQAKLEAYQEARRQFLLETSRVANQISSRTNTSRSRTSTRSSRRKAREINDSDDDNYDDFKDDICFCSSKKSGTSFK
ncbi:hypothetical protein ABEB36_012136 [Hypothenemus hampei]|uniref:Uncharacterized protein n=1 Tax=Hypothenemus hampei TaxID=57062 RepID=A0ABD1EA88_HYPHA